MHSSAGCSCTDGIHTQKKQVRVISILRPSFARSPPGGHNLELHSQGGRFYRGIAMYCLQVIVQGCWARRVPFAALVRQRYVQHDSLQSLLLADIFESAANISCIGFRCIGARPGWPCPTRVLEPFSTENGLVWRATACRLSL